MKNKLSRFAVPYVVWMAIFVVAPIVIMVIYAFSNGEGGATLSNFIQMGDYAAVFGRSFKLALIATAICLLIGYPLAYIISRVDEKYQNVIVLLIMLPMWMNFLLRTYAWMSLLEDNGIINNLLAAIGLPRIHMINTSGAVVLGMVYNYLPYMVLPLYSVLTKIDGSVIEAAQDLGANRFQVFRRVIFPMSMPGIISGITMVFVPSVSTFIISKMLGGGGNMLIGDLIEMEFLGNSYNPNLGSAISLVLMVLILISMGIMNQFSDGEDATGGVLL